MQEKAIINTKRGKAEGLSDMPIELVLALGGRRCRVVCWVLKSTMVLRKNDEDWRKSTILPIFKKKGDISECGDYWDIKLTEYLLKVLERIIDGWLRSIVRID